MKTLRELQAELLQWFTVTSSEQGADGKFVFRGENGEPWGWAAQPVWDHFRNVPTLGEAHGIRFLCPKAFERNGGEKGTHSVYVFFTGSPVPSHIGTNRQGQPVRWNASGSGLDDLVLTPSIQEEDQDLPPEWRCSWHGFVGSNGIAPGHAG